MFGKARSIIVEVQEMFYIAEGHPTLLQSVVSTNRGLPLVKLKNKDGVYGGFVLNTQIKLNDVTNCDTCPLPRIDAIYVGLLPVLQPGHIFIYPNNPLTQIGSNPVMQNDVKLISITAKSI